MVDGGAVVRAGLGPSWVKLVCSNFLPQTKNMIIRLNGNCKMFLAMGETKKGHLSPCVPHIWRSDCWRCVPVPRDPERRSR